MPQHEADGYFANRLELDIDTLTIQSRNQAPIYRLPTLGNKPSISNNAMATVIRTELDDVTVTIPFTTPPEYSLFIGEEEKVRYYLRL